MRYSKIAVGSGQVTGKMCIRDSRHVVLFALGLLPDRGKELLLRAKAAGGGETSAFSSSSPMKTTSTQLCTLYEGGVFYRTVRCCR